MTRLWAAGCAALALSGWTPVQASTVAQNADPIGAMLDQAGPLPEDEDSAEEAPPAPAPPPAASVPPPAPPIASPPAAPPPIGAALATLPPAPARSAPAPPVVATTPRAPPPYNPPPVSSPPPVYAPLPARPRVTTPVHIDEVGRSPEAAPTFTDLNYEARLRASFASAQGLKGPLDGSWRLSAAGGDRLYELQLVDNGTGGLEGVWRDVRRPGALDGSGFVTDISRVGSELRFRLGPQGTREPASAVLTATPGGGWNGELTENGHRRGVLLQRN